MIELIKYYLYNRYKTFKNTNKKKDMEQESFFIKIINDKRKACPSF